MFKIPDKVPSWLLSIKKDSWLSGRDMAGIFGCGVEHVRKRLPPDASYPMMHPKRYKHQWRVKNVIDFIRAGCEQNNR